MKFFYTLLINFLKYEELNWVLECFCLTHYLNINRKFTAVIIESTRFILYSIIYADKQSAIDIHFLQRIVRPDFERASIADLAYQRTRINLRCQMSEGVVI